jgi:hypothetical protein
MMGSNPRPSAWQIVLGESDSPRNLLPEPFWLQKRYVRFAYSGTKLGTKNVVTIGEGQLRALDNWVRGQLGRGFCRKRDP